MEKPRHTCGVCFLGNRSISLYKKKENDGKNTCVGGGKPWGGGNWFSFGGLAARKSKKRVAQGGKYKVWGKKKKGTEKVSNSSWVKKGGVGGKKNGWKGGATIHQKPFSGLEVRDG